MNMRLPETPVLRRRLRTPTPVSPRPRHAALAVSDQPVPRVPHNVPCPVCGAGVGTHCIGRTHCGGAPSASHPERRLLAGQAARQRVYGHRSPTLGDSDGAAQVRDSLAGDPLWDRR